MSDFKPGDKVVYARPWEFSRLKKGEIYTVSYFTPAQSDTDLDSLNLEEFKDDCFSAFRFDKVEV